MRKRVDFWVKIYSKYSTTQGVFHLVDDPSIVLGEIDVTDIFKNTKLTANEKKNLIKQRVTTKKNLLMAQYNIKNPREVRLQILDNEGMAHACPRGLRISLNRSPTRLKLMTVITSAIPGKILIQ